MSNAAIAFHPDAFQATAGKLMGRHSAGESFLRGFLAHAEVERLYFWNYGPGASAPQEALVQRIAPTRKPLTWIGRGEYSRLGEPGCMFIPSPANAQEAWSRNLVGQRRYSIVGLTHTIASAGVMDAVANMMLAPVQPWDSLICTSSAVAASVAAQLDMVAEHCRARLGAARIPPIRLDTIPLGVNSGDFAPNPADRARWRRELGIPDDAVVALYVGRFSFHAKMHPVPMAMALERAARASGKEVHWIVSGWAPPEYAPAYEEAIRAYSPSVRHHFLDGRRPEVRFSIWAAADLFLSLSDNLQESFGLTPVEAMAAGLPCVISDWDGYRDTVRDGIDGFRIPTICPPPGGAVDLAFRHANGWDTYDSYIGAACQVTAVDVAQAADALEALIRDPDLRARMGAAALARARGEFDWSAIIPRYQALWAELAAIRSAAADPPPVPCNPWRPEPFTLFAGYPSAAIGPLTRLSIEPDATAEALHRLLASPSVKFGWGLLPRHSELHALLAAFAAQGACSVEEIAKLFPPGRRAYVERGLLWLAKYGFLRIDALAARLS